MIKHTQLDYPRVSYGDASIVENGCACCVMASLTGKTPEDVATRWGLRYWDDDFGTLPVAFQQAKDDFGLSLRELKADDGEMTLHIGNAFILLADDDVGKHYELLFVRSDSIERHDPRHHGVEYLCPQDAKRLIKCADKVWEQVA